MLFVRLVFTGPGGEWLGGVWGYCVLCVPRTDEKHGYGNR